MFGRTIVTLMALQLSNEICADDVVDWQPEQLCHAVLVEQVRTVTRPHKLPESKDNVEGQPTDADILAADHSGHVRQATCALC